MISLTHTGWGSLASGTLGGPDRPRPPWWKITAQTSRLRTTASIVSPGWTCGTPGTPGNTTKRPKSTGNTTAHLPDPTILHPRQLAPWAQEAKARELEPRLCRVRNNGPMRPSHRPKSAILSSLSLRRGTPRHFCRYQRLPSLGNPGWNPRHSPSTSRLHRAPAGP